MADTRKAGGISVPLDFNKDCGAEQATLASRGVSAALPSQQGSDATDGSPAALAAADQASSSTERR